MTSAVPCYGGRMSEKLHHATIILERSYATPVKRVFAEFADPLARQNGARPRTTPWFTTRRVFVRVAATCSAAGRQTISGFAEKPLTS